MGQTQKSLIQRLMTRPQVYLSSTRTDLIQMNHHHQAQRYIWGLLGVWGRWFHPFRLKLQGLEIAHLQSPQSRSRWLECLPWTFQGKMPLLAQRARECQESHWEWPLSSSILRWLWLRRNSCTFHGCLFYWTRSKPKCMIPEWYHRGWYMCNCCLRFGLRRHCQRCPWQDNLPRWNGLPSSWNFLLLACPWWEKFGMSPHHALQIQWTRVAVGRQ